MTEEEFQNIDLFNGKVNESLANLRYAYLKEIEKKECFIGKLQKQLKIAKKALNDIRDVWANNPNEFSFIARIANRKAKTALEEMEGVK